VPLRSECSTSCRVVLVRFFFGVVVSLGAFASPPGLSVDAAGAVAGAVGVAAGAGLAAGAG